MKFFAGTDSIEVYYKEFNKKLPKVVLLAKRNSMYILYEYPSKKVLDTNMDKNSKDYNDILKFVSNNADFAYDCMKGKYNI